MKTVQGTAPLPTARPQPGRGPRILLVRHGETDALGATLSGRAPGVHLNARGLAQARALATRLRDTPVVAVYASPRERAVETAQPIADAHGLALRVLPEIDEVDFGAWTGLPFAVLQQRDEWRQYNAARAAATIPGGEAPAATQRRVLAAIAAIADRHHDGVVVAVSHAEPIRYARLFSDGRSIDEWPAVEIETAAIVPIGLDVARVGASAVRSGTDSWS
jgi:probable phosphoglycerate mutase